MKKLFKNIGIILLIPLIVVAIAVCLLVIVCQQLFRRKQDTYNNTKDFYKDDFFETTP